MRILIVSSFFPYPLHAGGYIRLYNLIQKLSKHHEITLLAEKRSKQVVSAEGIKALEKICKRVIIIPAEKQWSLKNIAKTVISPYPFLLTGHTSRAMKQAIIQTLQEKTFDLIHVETFYVMQNLPKTYLPIVLAEHNIEHQVYRKYVDVAPVPLRPFLLADIEKIKYWEKKFWKRATMLVAVSQEDKTQMGREDTVIVPNGVAMESFPFIGSKKKFARKGKRILFMGDFKWVQNKEAANFILDKIWPLVQSSMNLKLWIVGKHIPEDIKSHASSQVIIDENAPDDTAKIYENSFLLLAPIMVGGGTSYKILESMASGVPVVTTELGVKGLGAVPGKHALVGKSPEEFSSYVLSLLSNEKKYESLQKEARHLIEEKFTWEEIAKEMERVYSEAIHI